MKFSEMTPRIIKELHLTSAEASGVEAAMSWLHMHPDQVPGRTLTKSEMDHKCATYGSSYETGFKQAGGRIVPDPEPTNAERLKAMQDDWLRESRCSELFIEYLDRMGVKAPGGES